MYINEDKKWYSKRNANRPNFHKGSKAHSPSQTIGDTNVQINTELAIPKLKEIAIKYENINNPYGFLTDLRNALGIPDSMGASKYGIITLFFGEDRINFKLPSNRFRKICKFAFFLKWTNILKTKA